MAKVKVTINPDRQQLTPEQVAEDLPKKIRYIREAREQLNTLQRGGAAWTAVAKSHDAAVMTARRYKNFLARIQRAEARRLWIATHPEQYAMLLQRQFENDIAFCQALCQALSEMGC